MTQTLIVVAIVAVAAVYVGRMAWRAVRGAIRPAAGDGCASGCGCSAPAAADRAPAGVERRSALGSRL